MRFIGNQAFLGIVADEVAGSLARVDVEASDAPGMIMVEHEARALLVGVIEGRTAVIIRLADIHVRDVLYADALRPLRVLARGSDPLVRGSVADPGRDAAVQMQRRAVIREASRLGV